MNDLQQLRDRMQENMELKGFSVRTHKSYMCEVRKFIKYYRRHPEAMGEPEIKEYLLHLVRDPKISDSIVAIAYSAIKFLYHNTLGRPWDSLKIPRKKKIKRIPEILSHGEIISIIYAARTVKYRTIFAIIYSAGLRISEAVNLKVSDIDSKRMTLKISESKGAKDRYALLSNKALELLREYWKMYRPEVWLFPGPRRDKQISVRAVQTEFQTARITAGITKQVTVHTLRHCFATHLLENGSNLFHIQHLLGHASLGSTSVYLHMQRTDVLNIVSPFDAGSPCR